MTPEELEVRFTYHPPKEYQPAMYGQIRANALDLAMLMRDFCPESRELSLAITALEESVFWANAAIARRS